VTNSDKQNLPKFTELTTAIESFITQAQGEKDRSLTQAYYPEFYGTLKFCNRTVITASHLVQTLFVS
jgi:hypothetical protein